MRHLEGTFNVGKRQALYYQAWLPATQPKAVILLVHGLADHSSRYGNVVDYLVPKSYSVWSYDQRGHGKSPGKRCYVHRFADLTGDLGLFVDFIKQKNPSLPLFIVGHSLGALEAALYCTSHAAWVTGAVLSGLVLKAGESVPKRTQKLVKILSVIVPRFGARQLECGGISRDETVVKNYIGDPLVFTGKIPARTGAEMIDAMSKVQSLAGKINLPVLLMHGASDRLAEPAGSQLFFDIIASSDKELHLFPGCYHEIFNEPCHDFVLGTLIRWLDKHILA
ncbi:alpha/beta hydrolase [Dehalogenimonas alkenigignens]|uniref:Monoacylglycerol lipase n=1 Tax=Dehalogenimonas alkenigignens TaxID=1217799 RepID=A0A0W0GJ33_9CHLR|nr:alpha/beta hydrolase [Dehalogenimonas alkenigignens]KTB48542.1 Lysophospholipase [Dehalogenimonas alkenigignens]PVV85013.1 alpha/beta hydrolase [Dehalogenimonas alkenigignens]